MDMEALPLHRLKMKPVALDSLLSVHELFEKAMSFALDDSFCAMMKGNGDIVST